MPVPWAPAELLQFFGPGSPFGGGLGRVARFMGRLQVVLAVPPAEVARDHVVYFIGSRITAQVTDI
jgi:hypothetical protein